MYKLRIDVRDDRGFTLIEGILAVSILSIVVLAISPLLSLGIRTSDYTGGKMIHQREVAVIAANIRNSVLASSSIIVDLADPPTDSPNLDFAITEVTVDENGIQQVSTTYYRYTRSAFSVIRKQMDYDEVTGELVEGGYDPEWTYGSQVTELVFNFVVDAETGTLTYVKATITMGSGEDMYSMTISVSPRN
jgi:prepilin-type N-terminal cleavage/methylation domain-containing protein